jgi:hypothetical protein
MSAQTSPVFPGTFPTERLMIARPSLAQPSRARLAGPRRRRVRYLLALSYLWLRRRQVSDYRDAVDGRPGVLAAMAVLNGC